ncbi:hypothetical protein ACFLU5_09130 [Bacteroidota bacterium]
MFKLLVFYGLFSALSIQQLKLVKTKIDDRIIVYLPEEFFTVPEMEIASKYISYRDPLAVFTDMSTRVDFAVNNSMTRWRLSDIELMKSFYKANIPTLYDKLEFIREDIETINNRQFVVFEFISTLLPNENSIRNNPPEIKYNYIQYTIVKGETLLFNFNAPASLKDKWEGTASEIMHSITIK